MPDAPRTAVLSQLAAAAGEFIDISEFATAQRRNELHSLVHFGLAQAVYRAERLVESAAITDKGRRRLAMLRHQADGEHVELFGHALTSHSALVEALNLYVQHLAALELQIRNSLGVEINRPARIQALSKAAADLVAELNTVDVATGIEPEVVAEVVVLACRHSSLRLRTEIQRIEAIASDDELLANLRARATELRDILRWPELDGAGATRDPSVIDYVNVAAAAAKLGWSRLPPGEPIPDEKFGILNSPRRFAIDYAWVLEQAFSRGRDFAVAYMDIDNFREFNGRHTETWVDRNILPRLMKAIEAFCVGRAFAYREGGDEYLVLLQNTSPIEAKQFFGQLREYLGRVDYPRDEELTVSIGVHVVSASHALTSLEARGLANLAKARAKQTRDTVEFTSLDDITRITDVQAG